MRTTLDIPDETFRRAKIAAVERGTTLRQLVGEALARELGMLPDKSKPKRTTFPVFTSKEPGALSPGLVDGLDAEEDLKQDGLTR